MSKYIEKQKEIDVLCSYDVVVVGAGSAGCAAAVTAARMGVSVLVIEKDGFLGGATVSQLVGHVLSTNCMDFQGIWNDWIRAVRKRGGVVGCGLIKQRMNSYRSGVDPEVVKYAWDDMFKEAGVDMLLHTYLSDVIVEDDTVKGVIVETKGGRYAIYAKRVIDASGDGVACAKANVPWEQGAPGTKYNQSLTKVFRMGNVDKSVEYPEEYLNELRRLSHSEKIDKEYKAEVIKNARAAIYTANKRVGKSVLDYRPEMNVFASRVLMVDTTDPWDMTRAEREGRDQAWECADFIKKYVRGFENSYLIDTNMHIGIRDSRRIKGRAVATFDDALQLNKYDDSIARSSWSIDIWPGDSYTKPAVPTQEEFYQSRMQRTEEGDYFDVRYGCIVAYGVENLLMAGRCISAEREAQASVRIQQTCQATGEAAGVAAAISIQQDKTPAQLDPQIVVSKLKEIRDNIEPAFEIIKTLQEANKEAK